MGSCLHTDNVRETEYNVISIIFIKFSVRGPPEPKKRKNKWGKCLRPYKGGGIQCLMLIAYLEKERQKRRGLNGIKYIEQNWGRQTYFTFFVCEVSLG